jgi:hypothetical protein
MSDNKSAFPVRNRWDSGNESFDLEDSGMTLKEYAAIHLKVPRSGNEEIDGMIRESVRRDFAEKALMKLVFPIGSISVSLFGASARESDERELRVNQCFRFANAMLAEWEKEAGK